MDCESLQILLAVFYIATEMSCGLCSPLSLQNGKEGADLLQSFQTMSYSLKENKKNNFLILSNENQLPSALHRICEGSGLLYKRCKAVPTGYITYVT